MRITQRLARDTKGAVLAEFVLAIVPVLTTFFTFVQLARLATARLVVKHGAIVGARAAAVITNNHENNPGQEGGGEEEVANGVKAAMGPWLSRSAITSVNVSINDASSHADPYNWVEVKVTATYACNVPMGQVVCGGRTRKLVEKFRMPHQGAKYEAEE